MAKILIKNAIKWSLLQTSAKNVSLTFDQFSYHLSLSISVQQTHSQRAKFDGIPE